jgi:signal transduction histidine kinase
MNMPDQIPLKEFPGDKRRNIFLCVKETLNNILKHSGATELCVDVFTNHHLLIRITDNGIGIDVENTRAFGNGLKNIARRMKNIGGTFKIENNKGTIATLELPL